MPMLLLLSEFLLRLYLVCVIIILVPVAIDDVVGDAIIADPISSQYYSYTLLLLLHIAVVDTAMVSVVIKYSFHISIFVVRAKAI